MPLPEGSAPSEQPFQSQHADATRGVLQTIDEALVLFPAWPTNVSCPRPNIRRCHCVPTRPRTGVRIISHILNTHSLEHCITLRVCTVGRRLRLAPGNRRLPGQRAVGGWRGRLASSCPFRGGRAAPDRQDVAEGLCARVAADCYAADSGASGCSWG